MKIIDINGFALSSAYGDGDNFGQPLGVKSIGLVEIKTDSNIDGIGETYAGVYTPELISVFINQIKPFLIGKDPLDINQIYDSLQIPFISNNGIYKSIISAVDIALWDIKGKYLNKPIAELLNKSFDITVKVYASGGSVAMSPKQIREDVEKIRNKGFAAYKMRVGYQKWDEDLDRVKAAKEILNEKNNLMVDAIMGTLNSWDLSTATEKEFQLREHNLTWLEEPLPPENFLDYKNLKINSKTPIALGEAFTGINEFESYITNNCMDVLQPDITHCGGYSGAIKLLSLVEKYKLPISMHVWGSPIAFLANLHFALAFNLVEWLEVPQVKLQFLNNEARKAHQIIDGNLTANLSSGLGISISDDDKNNFPFISGSGYRIPG